MSEEYKRSLCHIEKIISIEPIPGADFIVKACLLGWELCVKKDEFKVGDLAVYIECDSVCDITDPRFEFLKDTKGRVKIRKFKKQIAMGLALPLSILPPGNYKEGQDCSSLLPITHHDPESSLHKTVEYKPQNPILKFLLKYSLGRKVILPFIRKPKGVWPGEWLAKTDEPRIQNMPSLLEKQKDKTFFVTEKIDYQSVTFFLRKMKSGMFNKLVFGVCSRNQWIKTEDSSLYWEIARKYNIEKILRDHYKRTGQEITCQGEQGNQSVQKNKYGIKEPKLWIFNIIDNRSGEHFDLETMEGFCADNNLEMVPILDREFKLPSTVSEMVEYSKGNSVINSSVKREGVVIRHIDSDGNKISFKTINPEFLLKYEKDD